MADFLQHPTPFMLTMSLTSASALLRAMKSGSSTLALSHLLVTAGMRTGVSMGATPGREMMSLS